MHSLRLLRGRPAPSAGRRRTFAGGFQGPTSRGMGRDGGGRGPGGSHRSPRGGAGRGGRGGEGEEGEGAFAAFQKKRRAALERDLDNARRATAEAAGGGTGAGVGGFGQGNKPGVRIHRQTKHPQQGVGGGRVPHRGGARKDNYAENVLRPAAEGHAAGTPGAKHSSGIPKLSARKPVGHQVHDSAHLDTALPRGDRRSNRANVRGEMSNRVMSDLEGAARVAGAGGGYESEEGGVPTSGLGAMMSRQGGAGMSLAPARERPVPERRSPRQSYVGGRGGGGGGYGGGGRGGYGGRGGGRGRGGGGGYQSYDRGDDDGEDDGYVMGDTLYESACEAADAFQARERLDAMKNQLYNLDNNPGDGYDSDGDLAPILTEDDPDYMDLDNHELVRKDDNGNYQFDWKGLDEAYIRDARARGEWEAEEPQRPGQQEFERRAQEAGDSDPLMSTFEYHYYFRDVTSLEAAREEDHNPYLLKTTKPDSDALLPLKSHGADLDEFLYALTDHPSKYAVIEKRVQHPDSQRMPHPIIPEERTLPGKGFVEQYKGYLFVTGLVPHLDEATGEVKDFADARHKQGIAEAVAELFGVKSVDVSPATPTSAFVGFGTKLQAKNAMIASAEEGRMAIKHQINLSKYEGGDAEATSEAEREFVAAAGGPESILKVTGLPVQATAAELLQSMLPPGTRLEAMFGPLTSEDCLRSSSTSALINMASADLVAKALKSDNIANNVNVVGQKPVQVFRAKRERVFDRWGGVNRNKAQSKLGTRLLVTGDMPPQDMFLSHNDLLHVSGLPPNVTLEELSKVFQPFSAERRDVYGSGHIVRCSRGMPNGCAYVGFELPGEIDAALEVYQGKATIGGAEVTLTHVPELGLFKQRGFAEQGLNVREGARPARSVDELRADLYDWERHVDPKDLQELESLGVEKSVLDEVMLALRHGNRTFAATDQAMPGERLYAEREVGAHYREVVQKYIEVLKSCGATKEEPGLMYEAMFKPDEGVDLGMFAMEEERIRELRKKGVE